VQSTLAIAAMVTAGEYRIERMVSVWRDERDRRLYVLPPCGRCREFIQQIDPSNIEARVILGRGHVVRVRDLLPYSD
jgi:cytidine deaminase